MSESKQDWKILVADDDEFARTLLKRHLASAGYEGVLFAKDGREALQMMREEPVDIVLLDVEMPEVSGVEVLAELKADLSKHDIPVIVISGENEIEVIVRCIDLGAEDYLTKPINGNLLQARLRSALEKKRMRMIETTFVEEIRAEKQRSDKLLEVILPTALVRELRATGTVRARRYEGVAVLFCDVVGFTAFSSSNPPEEVVSRLQALIVRFEEIANSYALEKIKTIGDAFMAGAGLNVAVSEPLRAAVNCGLEMCKVTPVICPDWEVRVGVADGPVVAGIVGREKYQFDIWGDTVNIAARMASVGNPNVVTMSHGCWLRAGSLYQGRMRGEIEVKGKGTMRVVECSGTK